MPAIHNLMRDGMIRNFRDHAANERTYLAWVRTGVAIMAFGFLVEKFDIFLVYIGKALHKQTGTQGGAYVAELLGMGLVALGIVMMIVATVRFAKATHTIDEQDVRDKASPAPYVALVSALIAMGVTLLIYLARVNTHP